MTKFAENSHFEKQETFMHTAADSSDAAISAFLSHVPSVKSAITAAPDLAALKVVINSTIDLVAWQFGQLQDALEPFKSE